MMQEMSSLWQSYTSICMSAFQKKLVTADKVPHPNLFVKLKADKLLCQKIASNYDSIPYQEFSNKIDKRYKAPTKPNSEDYYKYFAKHKAIDKKTLIIIQDIFGRLQKQIEEKLGYYVSLANVRLFDLNCGAPDILHTDNFPCGIYKVLIYLSKVSLEDGTTKIQVNNNFRSIDGELGDGILFDSNNLPHSSIAPTKGRRITIELTVMPSLFSSSEIPQPGLLATYPKTPPESLVINQKTDIRAEKSNKILLTVYNFNRINTDIECKSLNVGGGPDYLYKGWSNLDGAFGVGNQKPFKFTPNCCFPFESSSMENIMCSHTLEYLNDATVHRLLSEISRVSKQNATLLVKIPCFKEILDDFISDNFVKWRFMTDNVKKYWASKNVPINDLNRVSFLFVNFWNDCYGKDHYEGVEPKEKAYFGPVYNLSQHELLEIIKSNDCHSIASQIIYKSQLTNLKNIGLGNINAWSIDQMNALLEQYNFKIVSNNRDEICLALQGWPKVNEHYIESSWHMCQKI